MLHRNLIKDDIKIDNMNKEEFCVMINQFKHLLIQNGVRKGEVTTVQIPKVDATNLAAVFACIELGLPLFIIPDAVFDVNTKANERINNLSTEEFSGDNWPVNRLTTVDQEFFKNSNIEKMMGGWIGLWMMVLNTKESTKTIDARVVPEEKDNIEIWGVNENDTAFINSDGELLRLMGFLSPEGEPFKFISHKETIYNASRMNYYENKNVGLATAYHHFNSFERSILPALMTAKSVKGVMVIPPSIYGEEMATIVAKRNIPKLKTIDVVYGLLDDSLELLFNIMSENKEDFDNTLEIVPREGQKYDSRHIEWEQKFNVKFL